MCVPEYSIQLFQFQASQSCTPHFGKCAVVNGRGARGEERRSERAERSRADPSPQSADSSPPGPREAAASCRWHPWTVRHGQGLPFPRRHGLWLAPCAFVRTNNCNDFFSARSYRQLKSKTPQAEGSRQQEAGLLLRDGHIDARGLITYFACGRQIKLREEGGGNAERV